jgi:hypothetical protein
MNSNNALPNPFPNGSRWLGPDTGAVKTPLTPAQLDELRPKQPAAGQPIVSSARQIAYKCGIKEIEGLVLRIEALEARVQNLEAGLLE